jgi:DNA-binding transcriptional LysR family regulator
MDAVLATDRGRRTLQAAMFELRHLRYFLAVAEELNFSRAAERLHIAQPALSAQIRTLEAQLGCELFTRTTRRVELTPNGKILLEDAREIVARADAAAAKLKAAGRGERGFLRISFAGHGAGELGSEMLRRFSEQYPAVDIELVSAATLEELQRLVLDRQTDLGFVWLPLLFEELTAVTVMQEEKFVVVPRDHPFAVKSEVRASEVAAERLVAPWDDYPPEFFKEWLDDFRPEGRREDDPNAMSIEECMSFAIRGVALYVVPESVQRFYPRPEVAFVPIADVAPARIALAWRSEAPSPPVAAFVETAKALLEEDAPAIHRFGS